MTDTDHKRFTAAPTAYLRNRAAQAGETIAVHFQEPSKEAGGFRSISLKFPVLVLTGYVANAEAVAEKVARILNDHWDDEA